MMNRLHIPVFSFLLAIILLNFAPAAVWAQDPQRKEPGPMRVCTQNQGTQTESGQDCNCRSRYKGDLLAVIVPCLREEVMRGTERMTDEFDNFLEGAIYAFLTLVIAIFGVKVLMAEGDPKKDGFILLLKIGAVLAFTNNFGGVVTAPFAVMSEGVEIVTDALPINSQACDKYVNEINSSGVAGLSAEAPWVQFDCVLGKLAGFAPETFLGASALGVTGAALWSGQFGSVFFMGVIMALFFLLKLIIRGTYTYMMAVMALGFLIFISPLLIPLIWMPSTQQYFDRWLNAFVSVMLMPMIVIAYLMLSFNVLDKVAFDPQTGVANMLDKDSVKELWRGRDSHNSEIQQQAVGDNHSNAVLAKDTNNNPFIPVLSGAGNANPMGRLYSIDFRSDEAGAAANMFFGFISLLLVTYLLMAMLDQLIQLSQVMLGGGFFMQSAVSDNPFERGLSGAQQSIQKTANSAFSSGGVGAGSQAVVSGLASMPGDIMKSMATQRR